MENIAHIHGSYCHDSDLIYTKTTVSIMTVAHWSLIICAETAVCIMNIAHWFIEYVPSHRGAEPGDPQIPPNCLIYNPFCAVH